MRTWKSSPWPFLASSVVLVACAAAPDASGPFGSGGESPTGSGTHTGSNTTATASTTSTASSTTSTFATSTGTQSAAGGGGANPVGAGGAGGAGQGGASASTTASTGTGGPCVPGTKSCAGTVLTACDSHMIQTTTDCATTNQICVMGKGCLACDPAMPSTCTNGAAVECLPDGSALENYTCDPLLGETCDPDGCKGACTPSNLGLSYIGCEYWPTVTLNPVYSSFDFAVAVANTASSDATVTITKGAATVNTTTVTANSLSVIKLPWVPALKGGDVDANGGPPDPGATVVVAGGAYRLRSTQPVTVYQLSALEYEIPPPGGNASSCPGYNSGDTQCFSYSNDASLLLPTNVLTGNYTALTWASIGTNSGFIAVTATQDATQVTVSGVGAFRAGAGISATGAGTVTLNQGDVLEMIAKAGACNLFTGCNFGGNLSGTSIAATKPVQVIGGHQCADLPTKTTQACDHIEETMFPIETLGTDYLMTYPEAPANPGTTSSPTASPQTISVAAIVAGTNVTFDPASVHGPITLQPGVAPLQITGILKDVHITSDQPILVAQFMQGATSVPSKLGDPSESLGIATGQYRKSYVFIASKTYTANYVNITAPMGAMITLDGAPVNAASFTAIGASGYGVARVLLGNSSDDHSISGDQAFGIVVYGYGQYTSYMYPGGLDLNAIGVHTGGG